MEEGAPRMNIEHRLTEILAPETAAIAAVRAGQVS
jgi:hypothetical protein